ncbi:MAG TPA: M15 family metallopeptidase [Chlamydiales bacterium]|nr:M15 family metallopeptidase [Chlamydiales bacterium]
MIRGLVCLVSLQASVFAMNWNEVLENHQVRIADNSIISKQYDAFSKANAPAIVDPRIKEIPILENHEELVDLRLLSMERISMMSQPNKPFEGPTFNSGLPNASKMRASVFLKLQKMIDELDEIAVDFGYEPGQVDILVFEGLRDLNVQKMLFEKKLEEVLLLNPDMSLEMAERETAKWVSPVKNNTPVHSTGAAVDIRLWNNRNNRFLDLGPFGVIWGDSQLAPTFSAGITDTQKNNRLYCLIAAERAGLTNYVYEWWHFSFGDRYDIYWKDQKSQEKVALYGSIE